MRAMPMNHRWTQKQVDFIIANGMLSDREISNHIGVEPAKIKSYRRRNGIKKDPKFLTDCLTNITKHGGGRPIRKSLQE